METICPKGRMELSKFKMRDSWMGSCVTNPNARSESKMKEQHCFGLLLKERYFCEVRHSDTGSKGVDESNLSFVHLNVTSVTGN